MSPGEGQICKVNIKDLMQSNCTKDNKYGFEEGKPCILLKLNRVRATWLNRTILFDFFGGYTKNESGRTAVYRGSFTICQL